VSHLHTILQKLKDHSVSPPAEIFDSIHKAIAEVKSEAAENEPLKAIIALREKAVLPPAFLFDNIIAAGKIKSPAKVVPFKKYIAAIAAALLLFAGIAIVFKLSNKKDAAQNDGIAKQSGGQSLPTDDHSIKDTVAIAKDKLPLISPNNALAHTTKKYGSNIMRKTGTATVEADGDDLIIKENDLLYSFTNFNYNNLPAFITSDNTDAVKVRIDGSASITLSEGMVMMMKRMYKQKRNGKPTAKARREKRKLQRWKNADTKFFDKNVEKNPMDPMDLAEFLF
jgi:hypothetical protein